jgi:hypothetical protein
VHCGLSAVCQSRLSDRRWVTTDHASRGSTRSDYLIPNYLGFKRYDLILTMLVEM